MASISSTTRQPGILTRPNRGGGKSLPSTGSKSKNTDSYIDLKIVIRLLPFNLSETEFFKQLANYYHGDLSLKYYVQGEAPKTPYDNPKFSRAYIKFKSVQEMDDFLLQVKHKPFVELDTNDSVIPLIEKSLYNKMPDASKKKKGNSSALEESPIYKAYLTHLQDNTPFNIMNTYRLLQKEKYQKKKKPSKHKKKDKEDTLKKAKKTGDQENDGEKSKSTAESGETGEIAKDEKRKKPKRRRKPRKDDASSEKPSKENSAKSEKVNSTKPEKENATKSDKSKSESNSKADKPDEKRKKAPKGKNLSFRPKKHTSELESGHVVSNPTSEKPGKAFETKKSSQPITTEANSLH